MGPFRDQLARIRFEYDAATCHYEREVNSDTKPQSEHAQLFDAVGWLLMLLVGWLMLLAVDAGR